MTYLKRKAMILESSYHKCGLSIAAFLLLLGCPAKVGAQEPLEWRWKIDGAIGIMQTFPGHVVSAKGNGEALFYGKPRITAFDANVRVSHALEMVPVAFQLGYETETYSLDDWHADDVKLRQLVAGARYYFHFPHFYVYPYVGLDVLATLGNLKEESMIKGEVGIDPTSRYSFTSTRIVRKPWGSAGAVVGIDIPLFTSISLDVSYTARLAMGGHYDIYNANASQTASLQRAGNFHRHGFNVGLSVKFPFSFTNRDKGNATVGLINLIFDTLLDQ